MNSNEVKYNRDYRNGLEQALDILKGKVASAKYAYEQSYKQLQKLVNFSATYDKEIKKANESIERRGFAVEVLTELLNSFEDHIELLDSAFNWDKN